MRRADDLLRGRIPEGVPAFVKIDVEGAELGVLKGMPLLLQRPNTKKSIPYHPQQQQTMYNL